MLLTVFTSRRVCLRRHCFVATRPAHEILVTIHYLHITRPPGRLLVQVPMQMERNHVSSRLVYGLARYQLRHRASSY